MLIPYYGVHPIPEALPMFPRGLDAPAWRGARRVDVPTRETLLGRLSSEVRDRAPERGARWPRWAVRVVCGVRRPRKARERAAVGLVEDIAHALHAAQWERQTEHELAELARDWDKVLP